MNLFSKGVLLLCMLLADMPGALAETLVTLDTRPGVSQSFLLLESPRPSANVILFAGGHGALGLKGEIDAPTISWGKHNFLVRTRSDFMQHGFTVAVVDAPSDRQSSDGMFDGFRNSAEHVRDIDAVIAYLRRRNHQPVWLVGTSRGTESAAYVMIHSAQTPAGLVLTSSMTEDNAKGTPVVDMQLGRIRQPVLLVSHKDDGCWVTLPSGNETIRKLLIHSMHVEVKYVEGGDEPISGPCQARSAHGYLGIEQNVVNEIADFITKEDGFLK